MGIWDDRNDGGPEEPDLSANLLIPWEQPDYAAAPDAGSARPRRDGFTPARRAVFLKHLAKYGCLTDAAKRTGVSTRTVYNFQNKDAAFARDCALAARMAAGSIELAAWERAVEGVDQLFACGGQVHVRKRYSDGLLRLLLQGAKPKKYGPNPGFTRKRLLAVERKRLKQEVTAEINATLRSTESELNEELLRKLDVLDRRKARSREGAGWTRTEDGNWIPPGWVRAEGALGGGGAVEDDGTPRDSV